MIALPQGLAPSLEQRLIALLAEVSTTTAPPVPPASVPQNRCVVCHQGGKLGGHHCAEDTVEWIHKSCHRRLHRRDKLPRRERKKIRAQERALRPTAC